MGIDDAGNGGDAPVQRLGNAQVLDPVSFMPLTSELIEYWL